MLMNHIANIDTNASAWVIAYWE